MKKAELQLLKVASKFKRNMDKANRFKKFSQTPLVMERKVLMVL